MTQKFILALAVLAFSLSLFAQPNAPDIVVAADGSGAFTSIQEAVLSVRDYKPTRTVIYVKNGTYNEKILIPANKCDITIIGQSTENVIITYGDYAKKDNMGTFRTSTLRIDGSGIRMENVTVVNSSDPSGGQAVTLHVEGDKCEFVNCRLIGNQDTVYTGTGGHREYYRNCYIEGTTDFIFGPATARIEECVIHCKSKSYITAASTPNESRYGLIFHNCRITSAPDVTRVYLGRPWREFASTIFMNCELPKCIADAGWHNWGKTENEKTARYAEYANTGEGAKTETRAQWSRQITDTEAIRITLENVMKINSEWTPSYDTQKTK